MSQEVKVLGIFKGAKEVAALQAATCLAHACGTVEREMHSDRLSTQFNCLTH
jgi:hypothetical protein